MLDEQIKSLPHLSERMLLDLVNGLEVVESHLRFRNERANFKRLLAFFAGSDQRLQQLIDQTMLVSLCSLLFWVGELTDSGRVTNQALTIVATRLTETR